MEKSGKIRFTLYMSNSNYVFRQKRNKSCVLRQKGYYSHLQGVKIDMAINQQLFRCGLLG